MRIKLIALLFAATALAACSDNERARRVLEDAGYTNVRTTGWSAFGCSNDGVYSTGFTATAVNGRSVSGVVCAGLLFRGSIIRFN